MLKKRTRLLKKIFKRNWWFNLAIKLTIYWKVSKTQNVVCDLIKIFFSTLLTHQCPIKTLKDISQGWYLAFFEVNHKIIKNKGQCTTGPTATTVQSPKQLIVKLHAKNQKILELGSEYNFEKVHFEPKFDLLTPIGTGQEFSRRHHIHSPKCLISV